MIDPLPVDARPDDALTPSFEAIYRAHHRDVLRYASLMLGDPDDSADVAADVFARAFDAMERGHGPAGRDLPWLLVSPGAPRPGEPDTRRSAHIGDDADHDRHRRPRRLDHDRPRQVDGAGRARARSPGADRDRR